MKPSPPVYSRQDYEMEQQIHQSTVQSALNNQEIERNKVQILNLEKAPLSLRPIDAYFSQDTRHFDINK